MTGQGEQGHLVVIGASAGGIEALSILVGTLEPTFPAPILVAQHLDPRRESRLGEILARRTGLPVTVVTDHAPLVPGTIHVVPPGRQVSVTDREIQLEASPRNARPTPSVDHVFSSAAEQFGETLVAVILTGTGSDGADGARRVKMHGGTVVVQDPLTARYPAMPSSLAPSTVDISAPIEAIGPILRDLVAGDRVIPAQDEEALLETFLADLRRRSGIDFSAYKRPTILRRLQRRMLAAGTGSLRDYIRYLGRDGNEYQRLTSSFLIKVTEFFRDAELFDHLRERIVPALVDEGRRHGRQLRVWSGGCATGEEAYSLAIVIADVLGDELPEWTVRIFATDVDGEAVAFARRGIYPASALAEVPPDVVERHFSRTDGEFEVRKAIRSMTVFGLHDLGERAPFPRIDLALCRNVLIYFTPELQRRALKLFAFALRDGGSLVLGKAETTSPLPEYFVAEQTRLKVFRRRGERVLVPPLRLQRDSDGSAARALGLSMPGERVRPLGGLPSPPAPRPTADRAQATLAALPIGVVAVDRRYDIVSINHAARRLLDTYGPGIGQDIVHLIDRPARAELRRALDEALAGRSATARLRVTDNGAAASPRWLEITCAPAVLDEPRGEADAVLTVIDATERVAGKRRQDPPAQADREGTAELPRRLDPVQDRQRRLLRDNDALTSANLELRAGNQELLVANEEVQAATEEVETLNEELQATNEELETLNEELQATIEELSTTNDDLAARSLELQHLAVDLETQRITAETERARLATLIETLHDAVLVVDRGGKAVVRNQAYDRLFGPEQPVPVDDSGRPVEAAALVASVAAGEPVSVAFYVTDADGRRRWYEANGHSVPAEMGIGEGGILVVHDTTDLSLRRLQEEFVGIVAHELRTPLTALRGYIQMLDRRGLEEPERPILPLALAQADRLQRMVDELFDVTRADRGRLIVDREPVALGRLIDETVEIASGLSESHHFVVTKPDEEVVLAADPGRLQQVLLNLLTNAIVHAPDSDTIEVRLRKLRRRVEIDVEDHGPGIRAAAQEALFAPFEQGRAAAVRSGLGLGLYIAREIVQLHGGTIDLDSEAGQGTTFTIRLPLTTTDVRDPLVRPDARDERRRPRSDGAG